MDKNFIPAYVASNEDLRRAVAKTPNAKRVLTVAGSGDQALFYTLGGAATVDTYDITNYARLIQDIKTSAIQILPYDEYIKLINDIYDAQSATPIQNNSQLMRALPRESLQIMNAYPNIRYFRADTKPGKNNLPTEAEYESLKSAIKKPFNFIPGDLRNLHTQLTQKYDVINLSNIFDTIDVQEQPYILARLSQFLTPNGVILIAPQFKQVQYEKAKVKLKDKTEIACTSNSDEMYLMQHIKNTEQQK